MPDYVLAFVIAAGVALLVTPGVIFFAKKTGAMDAPDPRKVHKRPIPRIGGLGIYLAFMAAMITIVNSVPVEPDVAFGTSVLYLVPGIPYLNSVCDFFSGHIKLGTERIIDAILLTASLSLGFCGAAVIMKIF